MQKPPKHCNTLRINFQVTLPKSTSQSFTEIILHFVIFHTEAPVLITQIFLLAGAISGNVSSLLPF